VRILAISHAGIRSVNRSVYRLLKNAYPDIHLVVPEAISGLRVEPKVPEDPEIVPMTLVGKNPRTYHYPQLFPWLETSKPDIILLENDPVSRIAIGVANWCRKNNAIFIAQSYENLGRGFITTAKSRGLRAVPVNLIITTLNYLMTKCVNGLLVINKDGEKIFNSYGYRNVKRIPLGFDKEIFRREANSRQRYRAKLGLDENVVLVAYFGRLVKQKGVHILLQALNSIKNLNWKLLLDSHHDNENVYTTYILEMVKQLGMSDRVLYFEADHFEIANYMRAADVMVAPSITTPNFKEQYGRAVQEAMACGCVTVVSDSGHLKDLVDVNSLVFKEGDAEALKNIIQNLIVDKDKRIEVSMFLENRAAQQLTTEIQSGIIKDLLVSLVNEKSG